MKRVLMMFCFALFIISFVSADIIFSNEPQGVYNLGDSIYVNFSVYNSGVADYVESYVLCGDDEFVVKKEYILIHSGESKKDFSFEFPAPIIGNCRMFAEFGGEKTNSTNEFKISDKIFVDYQINSSYEFSPGEKISIKGFAKKENGEPFFGIVTLMIGEKSSKGHADNGNFSLTLNIAEDIFPGDYDLLVRGEDGFLNSGEKKKIVHIKPKPTNISIGYTENSFKPPYNFTFNVSLLDRAGNLIPNKSVLVKIFNFSNDPVFSETILSGDSTNYFFKGDSPPADWRIEALFEDLYFPSYVSVEKNEELNIEVRDGGVVWIRNVGNVEYDKGFISFNLTDNNGSHIPAHVNLSSLGVGESKEIISDYYRGNYSSLNFEGETFYDVSITGDSIFFTDELNARSYIIGFLILGVFIFGFLYRKKLVKGLKYGFGKKDKESFGVVKKEGKRKKKKVISANVNSRKVNACMVFLEFAKFVEMDDLFEAYGFSFKPVGENLGYVLFYSSPDKSPEKKMFNFARSAKRFANENEGKVSIVINSMPFRGMDEVKDFASFNRRLVSFSDGEIFIPQGVCKKIGINNSKKVKKFKIFDEEVEVCVL